MNRTTAENRVSSPAALYPSLRGVAGVLLFSSIPLIIAGFLSERTLTKWPLLFGELTLLLPAYLHLRHQKLAARTVFRLRPVSARVVAVTLALGLAITVLAFEVDCLVSVVLPFPEQWEAILQRTLQADSAMDWVIMLLAAVLFAGVFEEMLFRGFVQNAFEQRHPPAYAIFITAILFGAVHLNPWWFLQFIFIAFFLGILAWKSDSIIPGAIVHAQNNLTALLLNNLTQDATNPLRQWHGHVPPLLLLAAVLVLGAGLRLFFRYCEEETPIPTLLNTPLSSR
ncbi:MAG: CPBP family intramembrane metalloprotease [candidate division KSB1 bacterium]|nr:CPBP family intramembrane metalloprotease [candidate division KSB1 bacterium]MDZ7274910.1 CPBP family intramembrane metalloprotease [candidate division KSB1 bacterium]MDZ7286638.1 CPBP family intramembrane metalloprotease [candidate division KSB1 bacterium]MDZ7299199.1 CPBP family intramembrane metalloprotease [candidate division KSB1 bacterium]MDZ7309166.1 CPBP family intramembrane metalloprotease [candidate division KSB1 bacterium]